MAKKRTYPGTPPRRRPAPRTPKHVFWIRRAIVLLVVVVLVALIVWAVKSFMSYRDALKHQQLEQARKAAQAEQIIEPVPCDVAKLGTKVTPSAAGVHPKKPMSFTVEIHNKSTTTPCFMQASNKELGIEVLTGDDLMYRSQPCYAADADKKILLDADDRYTRTFSWKAVKYDAKCTAGKPLKAGTYRVHTVIDDHHFDDEAVFQVY